jgi:phosphoserine aminotransferase
MQIHNFGAGPCILPQEVFRQAAEGIINLNNSGLSVLEISHRSKAFDDILAETKRLVKSLLHLSDDYHVLFLQGGASLQFAMLPMNFLAQGKKAAYLDTGVWSSKAIQEARLFGETVVVASSKDLGYSCIPKHYSVPDDAVYFHITTNNTIYGTEIFKTPISPVPLVADMSSDIFSREMDLSKYDLIYAGAQKNMGPAGLTMVLIRDSFLSSISNTLPSMLDYRIHAKNDSLYNTPPVYAIYVSMLNLQWLEKMGGVSVMEQINQAKANLLYAEIDRNENFTGNVTKEDRSRMNVTFTAIDDSIEKRFLELCKQHCVHGIKGHRLAGGFRASLYNALPLKSVEHLVKVMQMV